MKKYIFFLVIAMLFATTTIIVAKSDPNGQPFEDIWNAIVGLREQISNIDNHEDEIAELETNVQNIGSGLNSLETKVQGIEDSLNSPDFAFCQRCGGEPWNCTRQEAAETCESLDMHLCSLAELNNYAEIGYSSCCWSWVSDPDLETFSRIKGTMAYFMGPSTRTGISAGCGGDPGGLRITTGIDHLNKRNAHCCK